MFAILRVTSWLRYLFFLLFRAFYKVIPPLRKRFLFEHKNVVEAEKEVFAGSADCAFEISSEGELEQVLPLVEGLWRHHKKVELIYSSPSVESKCQKLQRDNSERLRTLRMPIVSYFPYSWWGGQSVENWITAPVLILCRYDFYPELLLLSGRVSVRLISASLKNKQVSGLSTLLWRSVYRLFDKVVCVNETERANLRSIGVADSILCCYDFRHGRIIDRLEARKEKLSGHSWMEAFANLLEGVPNHCRLIVGSAWPSEMEIFKNKNLLANWLVVVAPHKLDDHFVASLEDRVETVATSTRCYRIDKNTTAGQILTIQEDWQRDRGPIFITVPGILVELYEYFAHALVGGGHDRSVHSLLEPFWAGCRVYCGPKTHRSSEADYIGEVSPYSLQIVPELEGLESYLSGNGLDENRAERRKEVAEEFALASAHILEGVC